MIQCQLPRRLRRRSAADRLLGLWVRFPPGTWMFICCECCVLSATGLCDELNSFRGVLTTLVRRCVWSRILKNEEAMARVGPQRHKGEKQKYPSSWKVYIYIYIYYNRWFPNFRRALKMTCNFSNILLSAPLAEWNLSLQFLSLHRAFWNLRSSLTNKCTTY